MDQGLERWLSGLEHRLDFPEDPGSIPTLGIATCNCYSSPWRSDTLF